MTRFLFVPGIKGSELFENNVKRWFPKTKDDLESLNINNNNLEARSLVGIVNAFNIHKVNVYSKLLDSFSPDELFVFYYDWRKSLLEHVDNLVLEIKKLSKIESSHGDGKVTIVAHSMGGILTKLAISQLVSEKNEGIIKKIITIGTPWLGAPDAYKALAYGEPGIFRGFSEILRFFDDKSTRKLARMLPSVYQLLPHEAYFNGAEGKFLNLLEDNQIDYKNVIKRVQAFYNEENKENNIVDVWDKYMKPIQEKMLEPLPKDIKHQCIIGYNYPTLYKIPENTSDVRVMFKIASIFKNGDGVVPFISAHPPHPNYEKYYVVGEHPKLCSLDPVINFIKWSTSESEGGLPSGITTDVSFENNALYRGVLASIMCPVESTILDDEGNYIAGVFDTSSPDISQLAKEEEVLYYRIGNSKYIYIKDKEELKDNINFKINAYDTGIADISLQVLDEQEPKEINFDPIPVTKGSLAVLKLPKDKNLDSAYVEIDEKVVKGKVKRIEKKKEEIYNPPIELSISIKEEEGTQKVPYRKIYSGPIKLSITSSNEQSTDQIFYSIDGGEQVKYIESPTLDLDSGTHVIEAYGKDIYNRPTKPCREEFYIEKNAPHTKIALKLYPDGMTVTFYTDNSQSKTRTFFSVRGEREEDIFPREEEYAEVEEGKEVAIPFFNINTDPKALIRIKYFSENEFGYEEEPNYLKFGLGQIPILMWDDITVKLTPRMIWNHINSGNNFNMDEFNTILIGKGLLDADLDKVIADDIKGIKFDSRYLSFQIMYSEKYSLYFSGPPTETLTIGQKYPFSFELLTERSREKVTNTGPYAYLHALRGAVPDKPLKLTQKDGVFYGEFTVTELFRQHRFKLIIKDVKNSKPALREIPLIIRDEEKEWNE